MEKQNEERHLALIHYSEIALKGKNRPFFESTLAANLAAALGEAAMVRKITGRIIVEYNDGAQSIQDKIRRVFGVRHFAFVKAVDAEMGKMKDAALSFFSKPYPASFRIEASRSEKNYSFTSQDVAREVGAYVGFATSVKVNLERPAKTIFIEIVEKKAYLYDLRIDGPGGLPVGVSGKVVALISSGFDSPVAALRMMKRGCTVDFVHFHSYPYTTRDSAENVAKIVKIISGFSPRPLKLRLISLLEIQQLIVKKAPIALAVIMYRRWMLKIAEMVAYRADAKALVTGDSVGQVASQTLDSIAAISEAVRLPVLRPLAGHDKEEIIDEAREFGTCEFSSLPFDDCCSMFTAGHPETHPKLEEVLRYEEPIRAELENDARKALAAEEMKIIKK